MINLFYNYQDVGEDADGEETHQDMFAQVIVLQDQPTFILKQYILEVDHVSLNGIDTD